MKVATSSSWIVLVSTAALWANMIAAAAIEKEECRVVYSTTTTLIRPPQEVQVDEGFGAAVALDHGNTLVVGAPRHNDNHGAVYVYQWQTNNTTSLMEESQEALWNTEGEWTLQQKLSLELDATNFSLSTLRLRWFGLAVAIQDDTLVVGAPMLPFEENDAVYELNHNGRVYVYTRSVQTGKWTLQQEVYPNDDVLFRRFGQAVVLQGDTLIATAPDGSQWDAAFVFERQPLSDTTVTATTRSTHQQRPFVQKDRLLKWDTDKHSWYFGMNMALEGNRLVVGHSSWAAYTYKRNASGTFVPDQKIIPSDQSDTYSTGFGATVALARHGQLLVGAPFAGIVYPFHADGTPFEDNIVWKQATHPDYYFAQYMAARENLLITSEAYYPLTPSGNRAIAQGTAHFFEFVEGVWEYSGNMTGLDPGDRFANGGLSINEDWVAIGAPQDDSNPGNTPGVGYVAVSKRCPAVTDTPTLTPTPTNPPSNSTLAPNPTNPSVGVWASFGSLALLVNLAVCVSFA